MSIFYENLSAQFERPLEELTGLPNISYVSEEFTNFERDQIFAKTWVLIANEAELPEHGWVHPVDLMRLPLLVTRDSKGTVRVFHNVCSHRGMILVEKSQHLSGIVTCPYHRWSYALSGDLKSTPHIDGEGVHTDTRFCPENHGLKEVRSHCFAGMIFINLSGDAEDFETFFKPVREFWNAFDLEKYCHGGPDSTWEITIRSNWKLAQENHVDGYHLPSVHPGLNSYSPLRNHYPLMIDGCASGQGSKEQDHAAAIGDHQLPKNPDLDDSWQRGRAEFLSIFPNIMIGVQADHFWVVQLIPKSSDVTVERMDLYYYADGATHSKYQELRDTNRDRMLEIYEEDRQVVEGMQKGRHSSSFSGGAFAPGMDQPAHCFNRIIANSVLKALNS